jgi:tetratricopeptide (TPR) repeat protein
MSLINEALKKAGRDAGDDALPGDVYHPQKVFFISGRRNGHRLLSLVLGALILGGLAMASLQMPSVTQRLRQLGGIPFAQPSRPRVSTAAPSPGRPTRPAGNNNASNIPPGHRAQVEQLIKTGESALQAGNTAEARAAFAKVMQLDSTSSVAQNGLGLVEKGAGRLADAERHYLEAIQLDPSNAEAHNNLALLYDQQGKADRAIDEYTAALSLRPNYPEAHLNYAIALERLGRTADAKVQYEKFLAHVPPELRSVEVQIQSHLSSLQ